MMGTFSVLCMACYPGHRRLFESVSGLIGGMSLAFITSLTGMMFTHILYYFIEEDSSSSDAELSDVVKALNKWIQI